jgi:hypothetical protein
LLNFFFDDGAYFVLRQNAVLLFAIEAMHDEVVIVSLELRRCGAFQKNGRYCKSGDGANCIFPRSGFHIHNERVLWRRACISFHPLTKADFSYCVKKKVYQHVAEALTV